MSKYKNIIIFVIGVTFGVSIALGAVKLINGGIIEISKAAIDKPTTEVNNTTEIDIKNKKGTITLTDTIKPVEQKKKKFLGIF